LIKETYHSDTHGDVVQAKRLDDPRATVYSQREGEKCHSEANDDVNDKIMTPGCHSFSKANGIPTQMVVLRNSDVCHRYGDEGR